MERINQYRMYELAKELGEIPGYGEPLEMNQLPYKLMRAKAAMQPFCSNNPPIQLTLSLSAAKEVLKEIDKLSSKIKGITMGGLLSEGNKNDIESWQLFDLRSAIEKFEVVLSAECEARPAFVAQRRGIYDTEELVNRASNAIPPSLQQSVPSKATDDLASAGRCLAFGLFTAAGFHICRAVEAVLETYFHQFTGKSGTLRSWHDYISALDKAISAGHKPTAEKQTLAYLNQLRDSSRNPIMHPRVVLEEADGVHNLRSWLRCHQQDGPGVADRCQADRETQTTHEGGNLVSKNDNAVENSER